MCAHLREDADGARHAKEDGIKVLLLDAVVLQQYATVRIHIRPRVLHLQHSNFAGIITSLVTFFILLHAFPARMQGASADKLQFKAAKLLPLDRLARSKQDPINRGHGAQCL